MGAQGALETLAGLRALAGGTAIVIVLQAADVREDPMSLAA